MRFHTRVFAASREFKCEETYDDIHALLLAGAMTPGAEGEVHWMPPLELHAKAEESGLPPVRVLIQPHTISAVVEI